MLLSQTYPSMPEAPTSWRDPAAFGYVVGVLLAAVIIWSWFQERRLNRQTKRLNQMDLRTDNAQNNAFVAALAVKPEAAVPPDTVKPPEQS